MQYCKQFKNSNSAAQLVQQFLYQKKKGVGSVIYKKKNNSSYAQVQRNLSWMYLNLRYLFLILRIYIKQDSKIILYKYVNAFKITYFYTTYIQYQPNEIYKLSRFGNHDCVLEPFLLILGVTVGNLPRLTGSNYAPLLQSH